ncbi:RibD family protein [Rubrobacter indicoceani]|uniref:RibD family protein n=1 Tax=Rubrobacter indicoceani TaxID=2051957 RepID=UPI001969564C|nr:dihydrofolate reductase family protein [Rubrobacter indicoceani]
MTVSYAQTLDGRIATKNGSSRWISSPESLKFAHELRAASDAILIGSGTARSDDPSLTVRHVPGEDPLRVLVDSTLRTSPSSAIFAAGAAANTIVATTENAPEHRRSRLESLGANVLALPATADGRVQLPLALEKLSELGVSSIMVEGGACIITALLEARLVDTLAVCIAPKILGCGVEAVGELGINDLDDSVNIINVTLRKYGPDVVFSGDLVYRGDQG